MACHLHSYHHRRRAVTLLELLVVVGILTILAAASIPLITPAFKDRKIREFSRQLNAMIAGAKAQASERGRPVGLWFERTANRTLAKTPPGTPTADEYNECLEIFLAEVPPPYTGDMEGAVATFIRQTSGGWRVRFNDNPINPGVAYAASLTGAGGGSISLVQNNEWVTVKFDYHNALYNCRRVPGTNDFTISSLPPAIASAALPAVGSASIITLPFQIYRFPRKSSQPPLDVPSGLMIDLWHSGFGMSGFANNVNGFGIGTTTTPDPVIVLFSPNGNVSTVVRDQNTLPTTNGTTTQTIHFLIGANNTLAAVRSVAAIQDNSSLWVSIGQRTGAITTADNYWDPTWGTGASVIPTAAQVGQCRQFARSAQTKGGG